MTACGERAEPGRESPPRWESTDVGAHLRGRPTRDTKPERELRRAVHAIGLRFRLNRRLGRYTPDFVLPRYRLAVFVDGCFWHGCAEHSKLPTQNTAYWAPKIARNVERDREHDARLAASGWRVLRVWEHEDISAAADRICVALANSRAFVQ